MIAPPHERKEPRLADPGPRSSPRARTVRRAFVLEDEAGFARELLRELERLRHSGGRRLRRAARGRLYLRRVFRENMASGGVPFVLPRKRPRPRRPRVLLLVDVSWSAATAAGLFLSLAGEFLRRRRTRARVVLFVDRPVEATAELERWWAGRPGVSPSVPGRSRPGDRVNRGGLSFAQLVAGLPLLDPGAASDYGRVFHALLQPPRRPWGRDTMLVVLGDARTNRYDPQGFAFEELARRAAAVLWLVPEPVEAWGSGDSALPAYLPHVDTVVDARDIRGLAAGVAQLLRGL